MSQYTGIIERLEKATGPDRELDCDIAFATNAYDFKLSHGFENCHIERGNSRNDEGVEVIVADKGKLHYWEPYNRYTSSLDAAISLFEIMLPDWHRALVNYRSHDGVVEVAEIGPNRWADRGECAPPDNIIAEGKTPSIALLIAMFRALEAEAKP